MNWKQIAKEYPGAFNELKEAGLMLKTSDKREWVFAGNHIREMYDFFDERGIFISINEGLSPKPMQAIILGFTINSYSADRSILEKAAFEHAFRVLDSQLKSKKSPEYTEEDMICFAEFYKNTTINRPVEKFMKAWKHKNSKQ